MKLVCFFAALLVATVSAEVYLEEIKRQIHKTGLHRELETNITYRVTKQ